VRRLSHSFLLVALLLVSFLAACSGGEDELEPRDIVTEIPWSGPESFQYRLLQGDDVKGTGELTLSVTESTFVMEQAFEIPEAEIVDSISAEVEADTLRPRRIERVIDGPEGERRCEASYSENTVTVEQRAEEDERTDTLTVPDEHYDSWSDLFLWRTVEFFEDQELKYVDVLSCSLAKPDILSVVLKVKEKEEVAVPAGTFEAWRLEIRSGGRTQKAWYADDERRTLVRYDNGDLVFELESTS
jgi:Protein of unknown function (DUF3108)